MSTEQKKLLYEIAKWRSDRFYNNMKDRWDSTNYAFDSKCNNKIDELEKQYEDLYGDLPEWRYIDDVWAAMEELKES